MSTIIKRVDARQAWIQIDDTTARLVTFDKDTIAANMAKRGDEIIARRERKREIKRRIEELKGNK